ncbi:EAL domain-containing protein [Massilia sp. CCM 9210]|uniref:putative bifunctional diguanylate cyclase/phosphodiesterase n=1 Tax=Massilia scottii TaxID=3057166 RepID=UPI002796E26C|nr:bifunctional diguanylate cyclase/phosphodiesterase [Massilia sp. CCM 9210]MDQ1816707.1 EAL domain-containing protein [Massilia sp. CCM 9210]
MSTSTSSSRMLPDSVQRALEALLRLLSFYLVPLGIALLSIVALAFWNNQYRATAGQPLPFRVMAHDGAEVTPAQMRAQLAGLPEVAYRETRMSPDPLWFSMAPAAQAGTVIEFPSRHMVEIACWDSDTLLPLGSSSRAVSAGAMAPLMAGFALTLAPPLTQAQALPQAQSAPSQAGVPALLLCRSVLIGPARLSATQWQAGELAVAVQQYHRKSGLLDGGMIVLTLFVLTTALINRQALYVLLAGWLILNLRMGALSAGWDIQWLGQIVPERWLLPSRALTIALYAVSTLTLYQTLFRERLAATRYRAPLRFAEWCCLPLLALSVLLPYHIFLPVMWGFVAYGLVLMTLGLVSLMSQSPSQSRSHTRVAFWFAASFAVTMMSGLVEVIAAALGVRDLAGMVNSVTAALASSLLAALAVAEQMRQETEQRIAAQAELRHAYEAMPVGLFTLDLEGKFLSANPALQRMVGADGPVTGGMNFQHFFADGVWGTLFALVQDRADAELRIENRDGSHCFVVRATLARGKIEGVLQDTTEQHKATEQLRFMANNDALTKVFNRRGIERVFENASMKPLTLAYLDLDRFKLINDLFGHSAGDEVLKQVCERIGAVLSGEQQVGRVGGDEFVIIMPETSIRVAALICRCLVGRIGNTPYRVGDKAFHVRGSIGLIEVQPGMQMKDAVSTADRACREAKTGHRDGLVVYERDSTAFNERTAELDLVERLSANDVTACMVLEMQPIMSLKMPYDSMNFEVLLRMREADGSLLAAGPIIAAAEKSGRMGVIDRWVLSTTLSWIERHADMLVNTQFVCMNLSGASLNDERFIQDTIDILRRHRDAASRLCMEITESVALHDLNNTRRFIDQVRNFGVKVALDDFGAGYTSFSYLKELPADILKIDGNFIVNMNAHPADVAIVEAIVKLAVNLGMKTIAEWAEDGATVQTLADIGVDYVQGFVIASSMAPDILLTVSSAAGFIVDEELNLLVGSLGGAASAPGPVAAMAEAPVAGLH